MKTRELRTRKRRRKPNEKKLASLLTKPNIFETERDNRHEYGLGQRKHIIKRREKFEAVVGKRKLKQRYGWLAVKANKHSEERGKYEGFYLSEDYRYLKGIGERITRMSAIQENLDLLRSVTQFAVSSYTKKKKTEVKAKRLLRANQCCSCINITFEVSDGKIYEAKVRTTQRFQLKFIRPARYYPAQSECYTCIDF